MQIAQNTYNNANNWTWPRIEKLNDGQKVAILLHSRECTPIKPQAIQIDNLHTDTFEHASEKEKSNESRN